MTTGDPSEQLQRARRVIEALRGKLAEVRATCPAPVAVIGMACRFPGEARDCDGFWRMIVGGGNAVQPVPADRARDLGTGTPLPAALLDDVATFDAGFFGISPREAAQMDPQQRLFLEVAWDALEDAGQTRSGLAGSSTGVFVGIHSHSSGYLELQSAEPSRLNEFSAVGSSHDAIAGRLAYVFDLTGPSVVINTACSSSLVAVRMACLSLWSGDSRMVVAGGVNLIMGSFQGRHFNLNGMLAPDGRCKTFDSRADGYGRGEGCGVVVLKRLSDAIADRDRVLAVIRGSAVNQDGRSNGLTAPNGVAQQALLRQTLARAGLAASRVGYVETHGTGTSLGDPIEIEAIAAVYGVPVSGEAAPATARCALGAAKANINHLEGAAGVAGLIKAILALRARVIPPVAGFDRPNPHLSLAGSRLYIPTEASEWHSELPRVAAVSAFSWTGVNAHLLVEEAPAPTPLEPARPTVLMVSAVAPTALSARTAAVAAALERAPDDMLESFAWTATARRTHYLYRVAVAAATTAEAAAALRRRVAGPHAIAQRAPAIGFMIGDDAATAAALAPELLAENASFRRAVADCAAAFAAAGEMVIATALTRRPTLVPGPARCFAFAMGIAALLGGWGIRAARFAGWGAGGLAARCLAGEITLAEAVTRLGRTAEGDAAAARLVDAGVTCTVRLDTLTAQGAMPQGSARLRLAHLLATLAEAGAEPDWAAFFSPAAQLVSLPGHPYHRRRHWVTEPAAVAEPAAPAAAVPDGWVFETRWQPEATPHPASAAQLLPACLILGDPAGDAARLAATLRTAGAVVLVESGAAPDPARQLAALGPGRRLLVDLRALDSRRGPVAAEALRLASQVADLDRAIGAAPVADAAGTLPELWLVTRGAQAVSTAESPDLAAAPLWGLGRSLSLANPARWGSLVDLDPLSGSDPAQLSQAILAGIGGQEEIAFRGGLRYVNRLRTGPAPGPDSLRLDPAASYMVVGASGGIGRQLAAWLARRGARHLVLVGRSAAAGGDLHDLRESGVEVQAELCDVGDPAAVAALFERVRRTGKALRGIVHAAAGGTHAAAMIEPADLAAAFHAKVAGSLALDTESRGLDLDFFVLFSSAAGVLGERMRSHYAAANAFQDALAAARRAAGLPALSINWGTWAGVHDDAAERQHFRRSGLCPMPSEIALNAMAQLLSDQARGRRDLQPLVAWVDSDRLWSALELRGRGRFLSGLGRNLAPPRAPAAPSHPGEPVIERLRQAPSARRRDMLLDLIGRQVRALLELAPDDVLHDDRGFFDLGMDSLMTVALKERLAGLFGLPLASTLTMEYPSVAALAGYFETLIFPAATPRPPAVPAAIPDTGLDAGPDSGVDALSDDEVADALSAELDALDLQEVA